MTRGRTRRCWPSCTASSSSLNLLDRDDWPEYLVGHDLVALLQAGNHRRLIEIAAITDAVPACEQLRMVGQPVDEAADPRELVRVVDRAVRRIDIGRRADDCAAGLLCQCSDEVAIDARCREHSRRSCAVLAGVEVAGHRNALGGLFEVRVIEDDDGRLAPELEVHALEIASRSTCDFHARAHAAGDRDHARRAVFNQQPPSVTLAAHDVQHARRQELRRDLGHQQGCHRRRVRRLEHDCVARGDRGRPLPDGHHHRVVPRRHLRAHTDRFTPDERREAGHVLPRRPDLRGPAPRPRRSGSGRPSAAVLLRP